MNTAPYAFPNPEDMTGLPTKAEENPHTQTSQSGEVPGTLPDANLLKVPFTLAIFPRVVIPYSILTQNMAEDQVEQIDEECLAIVPWNAGPKCYKENPHANREVAKFLESLPFGTSEIEVALPKAKHKEKRDFEGPWPMLLKGADEDLTKFLLWHQTFSVNVKLTFSVVRFDKDIESWVVMTISGDAVRDTPHAKAKVLGAIKRRLWNNTPFVNFVNGVLGAAGVAGSGRQRVVEATRTFQLTYVETDDQAGDHAPVFQLTAKPITTDPAKHRQWLALIRGLPGGYVAGLHALHIDKRWVNCTGCKSQMHPAHSCPLPKITGWLGQVPDNAARHAARIEQKTGGGNGDKGKGKDKAPRSRNGLGGRSGRTLKVCGTLSTVALAGPPGLKCREPQWKHVFAQTDAWTLWEYTANGIQWAGSSRGGAGSTASHVPNDGAPVFGGGHASHGQRELGIDPMSRGPLGEEQRPAATGSVRHRSPVSQNRDGLQSESQSQSATDSQSVRGNQNSIPAQSAHTSQSAGGSQNARQQDTQLQGHRSREPDRENGQDDGENPANPQQQPTGGGNVGQQPNPGQDEEPAAERRPNRRNRRAAAKRSKKNTKAAIRVASLNIKGWKATGAPQPKWNEINQTMREKRIGILLVQEAHLDEQRCERVIYASFKRDVLDMARNREKLAVPKMKKWGHCPKIK
ncbi:hypothetical protein B0H19DRAFT_1341032 [Mycena capillaripes]|nr:hypothetical protein B0H19DRAFT_1341032 [Mycena capillaripes]